MATQKFEGEEFEFPDEKEQKAKFRADESDKAEDSDVKIEVEDDTPLQDRGRKAGPPPEELTDDELNSYDEKVQARFKKFTRGYHDERRAKEQALREKEAAEEFARKVFEQNKQLQQQLASGSKAYIETSQSAAQVELEAAKDKYRKAYEAGDADAIVSAQEAIAKATVKIDKAQSMRPIEIQEQENFVPASAEPSAPQISPRTKRWMDKNSDWFGVDEEMTMAAMGIDKKLQREYGAEYVGTEEYFKTVDRTMKKRFPEFFESQSDEEDDPPPRKRSAPVQEEDDEPPRRAQKSAAVVAPASRSSSPNRIKLKESQVALARKLGITPEQYAKQVALLTRS